MNNIFATNRKGEESGFALSLGWFVVALLVVYIPSLVYDVFYHNVLVLCNFISYILCIYSWRRFGGRWLSVFVFFIVYALFCNLGNSILYSTMSWTNTTEALKIYENAYWMSIIDMLRFQFLCVASMNVGVSAYTSVAKAYIPSVSKTRTEANTLEVFWLLTVAYHIYLSYHYLTFRITAGYSDLDSLIVSEDYGLLGTLLTYFFLFLSLLLLFKGKQVKTIYLLLTCLSLAFMISGKRYMAIRFIGAILVFLGATHPRLFRKRYVWIWVAAGIGFMAFINVIRVLRGSSIADGIDVEKSVFQLVLGTFAEMGQSEWPAIITMDIIGSTDQYMHSIYNTFLRVTGFDVLFGLETEESLGRWITNQMGTNYGLGYSFVAEAYANFGWLGWIFTFIYGWLIVWLENSAYRMLSQKINIYVALAILCLLLRQIFYARAQLDLCAFEIRMLIVFWGISLCMPFLKRTHNNSFN